MGVFLWVGWVCVCGCVGVCVCVCVCGGEGGRIYVFMVKVVGVF